MNPANIKSLASYLQMDVSSLKEIIARLIEKNQLNVKIVNEFVYYFDNKTLDINQLLKFKSIKEMHKLKWFCERCKKEFEHPDFSYDDLRKRYGRMYDFEFLESLKDSLFLESIFPDDGICPFCKSTDISKKK